MLLALICDHLYAQTDRSPCPPRRWHHPAKVTPRPSKVISTCSPMTPTSPWRVSTGIISGMQASLELHSRRFKPLKLQAGQFGKCIRPLAAAPSTSQNPRHHRPLSVAPPHPSPSTTPALHSTDLAPLHHHFQPCSSCVAVANDVSISQVSRRCKGQAPRQDLVGDWTSCEHHFHHLWHKNKVS